MAKKNGESEMGPLHVTDIEAIKVNVKQAVDGFARQWLSMPRLTMDCVVMDQRQLRDAMGMRATFEYGDPWPKAEQLLQEHGFRWHQLGSQRVMYLREREEYQPDDGWEEAEEVQ